MLGSVQLNCLKLDSCCGLLSDFFLAFFEAMKNIGQALF